MEIKPLVSINDLIEKKDYHFFIPSYQRGYRWDENEVKNLLEDFAEFENNAEKEDFYCLQPLVVKKEKKYFRVIDGQQRLTTIYLILKALENLLKEEYQVNDFFTIEYETRTESQEFLEDISKKNEQEAKKNIDFWYMYKNFHFIKNWLNESIKNNKITPRRLSELLLSKSRNDGIKFIWYEIEKNEKEEDVFTRLNIGKIPLTNAELIKALFLFQIKKRHNNKDIIQKEQNILVSEWDNIEISLQNDRFFHFLFKEKYDKPSRIEFIFDLIADDLEVEIENLKNDDEKRSFYIFNEYIDSYDKARKLWKKVKYYYRVFEELYNNLQYYHLVGYLTNKNTSKSIAEIIEWYKNLSKDKFLKRLKDEIIIKDIDKIEDLDYYKNKSKISDILFLFNILISIESRFFRYPFDLHKKEKWSLEHINPQNPLEMSEEEKEEVLKGYIDDEKYKEEIENVLKIKDVDKYNEIIRKIIDYDDDSLGNLTLLSQSINSSIGNNFFKYKRKEIINLDKDSKFVPPATKLVFLKYFTQEPKSLYKWEIEDKKSYIEEIKNRLKSFGGE
ncbi:hypothetical protein NitYY0826_C1768 [Nitratiruptor sp. YY08-26]|uniref:DUF262 domain-containing protein n=1 Tax=unclassified Nitratiruptor TaxID=2624044 RepID=UPI0019160E2F|nr:MULTISPECIES: DUF262 domain-containing protein [unclassified Nitratiruptor]BCD62882.1 hypothetical protein NitYY0813_C1766 [Nitratiruptor sp. YY08-13]BCD66818.1 hypothetical protein NitYY0826_C1768 [Nitratiruptor sp. YY08-26]